MDQRATLQLSFTNEEGGTSTITVANPREDLTEAMVQAAMDTIIEKGAMVSTKGSLTAKAGAKIVRQTVEELAV